MSVIKTDECRCECHSNSDVKHVTACCMTCPVCKQNIRILMYEEHLANHAHDRAPAQGIEEPHVQT